MDDEALRIGRQQVARIDAGLARANADYAQAVTEGDEETAGNAMQNYADVMQQRNNLIGAYHQQLAAEQAAQAQAPTAEQINAKRLEDMSEPEREWWMSQQSKHGFDREGYARGKAFVQQNPIRR